MLRLLQFSLSSALIVIFVSCSSSGPKTQFYSLFADKAPQVHALDNKSLSIGIGPVELPEYIEHPGIVSVTNSNRVIVSGFNAWAGDLKENISRVLASNLSTAFELDQVWAFPWNNRIKPDYKIRLVFEDFSGLKGGEVNVALRWSLLDQNGKTRLFMRKVHFTSVANSDSYNDYVSALNNALNLVSENIAVEVAAQLNPR